MTDQTTETTQALSKLLGSSYTLYLKTQNYHWNVTGPMFTSLHTLFENQYGELAMAIDEIAERIRALGDFAPGSFSAFAELSAVKEDTGRPNADDMIRALVEDQQTIANAARDLIKIASAANDDATVDLGVRRLDVHQKNAWMLRSHLA